MSALLRHLAALGLAIGTVAFIVLGSRVSSDTDLAGCVGDAVSRKARLTRRYLCSPRLLPGSWKDRFVFVWMWSFPLAFVAISAVIARLSARPYSSPVE